MRPELALKRPFELFGAMAELRKSLFEIIAKERHAQQVFRRPPVMGAGGFRANVIPMIQIAVPATEPGQCDKVDLLVLVQSTDDRGQFRSNGIVGVVLKDRHHGVVAGIGQPTHRS